MKLMFVSDIHGSAYYCRRVRDIWQEEMPQRLVLLGDLLYHGPRNDLPKEYAPKECIDILNGLKSEIIAVRGNCEAEVDQMVLQFDCLADHMLMYLEDREIFITHGHIYSSSNPPHLKQGSILIHGHTHIPAMQDMGGFYYINPGSVSIPKNNSSHNYMIYEDGVFTIKDIDGRELMSYGIVDK